MRTAYLVVYELARFFFFVFSHPLKSVQILPPSWYAAVPLLVVPPVLAFLLARGAAHQEAVGNLYTLSKAVSALGLAGYAVAWYVVFRRNAAFMGDYALRQLVFVLIFFAIDAILALSRLKKLG